MHPSLSLKARFTCCPIICVILLAALPVFARQPMVSSFSPTSGPTGTTVVITGTGLSSTASDNIVYFGAARAAVIAANGTSLTVTVPVATTHELITVTVGGLTAYSKQAFHVTFAGGGSTITNQSFGQRIDSVTGLHPYGIVMVDLDGDGKADIATVANAGAPPPMVGIHRNTGGMGAVSFASPAYFAAPPGSNPYSIAAGDLDGDGKKDIVTTSITSNLVSVYRNTSTPGSINLATRIDLPTGSNPYSVAIGDIDGDGKPDLAIANFLSATISVFRNTSAPGNISFAAQQELPSIGTARMIAIGDLDGDTKPDLVVTNSLHNSITLYRNQSAPGNISFASGISQGVGTDQTCALAISDLDADGKGDLVITGNNTTLITPAEVSMQVLKNVSTTGNLSFIKAGQLGTGDTYSVIITDVNGDGKPDLVASNSDYKLFVCENTGTVGSMSFAIPAEQPTGHAPYALSAGDLNEDGLPDIATANFTGSSFSVLKNRVTGPAIISFSPTSAPAGAMVTITGTNFTGATAVQFGGVAAASFTVQSATAIKAVVGIGSSGEIAVTTPKGTTALSGFTLIDPPAITSFSPVVVTQGNTITIKGANLQGATAVSIGGVAASSFNIISPIEIQAVVGDGASGKVAVTTIAGTAEMAGLTYIPAPVISSFTPTSGIPATKVTITGTAFIDVTGVSFGGVAANSFITVSPTTITAIVHTGASGAVTVSTKYGSASLNGFTFVQPPVPKVVSFAPLSGPVGTTVTINGTDFAPTPANNIVFFGAVRATVSQATVQSLTVTVPYGVTYKPLSVTVKNLTGYADRPFHVTMPSGGGSLFTSASFGSRLDYTAQGGSMAGGIADLDGDGIPDLAIINYHSTSFSVARNTSTAGIISFAPRIDIAINGNPFDITIGDIDGDGKPDLVIIQHYTFRGISVFRNLSTPGNISFAPPVEMQTGKDPNDVAIVDLNGDGKADLVVTNNYAQNISIYKNTGILGSISFETALDLPGGGNLCVADFDGDKKQDIAVGRNTGALNILRNTSENGNFTFDVSNGQADYVAISGIAAGDFDGDNKPDLALTKGYFVHIYQNKNIPGSVAFGATGKYATGLNPYSPTINDLDGDGKLDLVVPTAYTPDDGFAIFRNTTTGGTISFAEKTAYSTGGQPPHAYAGDLNADGRPDIVIPDEKSNVSVWTNHIGKQPGIVSFTPRTAAGGVTISIQGSNFTGATAVLFGGVPAASFTIESSTSITAVTGAHGGSGTVEVLSPTGKGVGDGFLFAGPPVISAFSPTSAAPGQAVTITGHNFTDVSSVSFGGITPDSFAITSPTTIVAIIGKGGTGNVSATNVYGIGIKAGFTYQPVPVITSFTPDTAQIGTVVTIIGYNFAGTTTVSFNGVNATSFTVVSPTTITAVVPFCYPGDIKVAAGNLVGKASGFVFNGRPVITYSGNPAFCAGTDLLLTSSSADRNQWYKNGQAISGATANTLLINTEGAYTVSTIYLGTATAPSAGVVMYPIPAKPTITWTSDLGMVSSATTGNQWYTEAAQPVAGATNTSYRPGGPGKYYVKVTLNGCSSLSSDVYSFLPTAVIDLGAGNTLKLSPNPTTDYIVLNFTIQGNPTLAAEVLDLRGRLLVKQATIRSGDRIDIRGVSPGIYIVKVYNSNGKINAVFQVMKR